MHQGIGNEFLRDSGMGRSLQVAHSRGTPFETVWSIPVRPTQRKARRRGDLEMLFQTPGSQGNSISLLTVIETRQTAPTNDSNMSSDDKDRVSLAMQLCEAIIEASEHISSLDPDLAYDVLEQIGEKDWVSDGQLTALQNIAAGFHLKY